MVKNIGIPDPQNADPTERTPLMYLSHYISQLRYILYMAPGLLLAIVCHECAHGLMSDRLGDPTPRASGRLTLNPLKHLDPLGTFCLLFFQMGWAKPVSIHPGYYKNRRTGTILVSLAGPAANLILAFLSMLIEGLLLLYAPANSVLIQTLILVTWYCAVINVGLGVFNLIPLPPLDGSHVLGELIPGVADLYRRFLPYWSIILIVLLASGALSAPLSLLDNAVLTGLQRLVYAILMRLPTGVI
ncbi:MAG: site-2 protease family protein [Eubacteriales bacterium]|nr:site-2 protease family protein [Eubacteriales bacterium]